MKYDEISKIAISLDISEISDCIGHLMEKESRLKIHNKLPQFIQEIGPIVHIEQIQNIIFI